MREVIEVARSDRAPLLIYRLDDLPRCGHAVADEILSTGFVVISEELPKAIVAFEDRINQGLVASAGD